MWDGSSSRIWKLSCGQSDSDGCDEESSEDVAECAICFDDLDAVGGAVSLPCACRVRYCMRCWNHALASACQVKGYPTCPSCRGSMRVDFDVDRERLVFTESSEKETRDELTKRIRAQSRPFELRLLEQYKACTTRRVKATGRVGAVLIHDAADSLLTYKLSFADGKFPQVDWFSSTAVENGHAPTCVCSGKLKHMSCRDRVQQFYNSQGYAGQALQMKVDTAMQRRPPIFCDVCDQWLPPHSGVWTCENGTSTILHALSYDVCDSCLKG